MLDTVRFFFAPPECAPCSKKEKYFFCFGRGLLAVFFCGYCFFCSAGAQIYQPLALSVRTALSNKIADLPAPDTSFSGLKEKWEWLLNMSDRLKPWMPDLLERLQFLQTVHYEAVRAGVDPQLVLGLIQVESNFKKYAVSVAGAHGYMQVMPFWVALIGRREDDLFSLRTSLRYGNVILRFYIDQEHGNLIRALARYNGSTNSRLYPYKVIKAWHDHWSYTPIGDHSLTSRIYLLHDHLRRIYVLG